MCCNFSIFFTHGILLVLKYEEDSPYISLITTLFKNPQGSSAACWWRAGSHTVCTFHLSIGSPNQSFLPQFAPTKLATTLFSNTSPAFLPPCSDACCSWYLQHLLQHMWGLSQLPSVQFSHSVMSDSATPWTTARQASLSITPGVYPNSCPLSQWCHPTISSSVVPFSSCLQSFLVSWSFQIDQSLHQMAKVLEFLLQHRSFQWIFRTDFLYFWLVGSLCSPRDSQESFPTPPFKSSSSSALSFLYSPTLTQIHDYWKTVPLTRWILLAK